MQQCCLQGKGPKGKPTGRVRPGEERWMIDLGWGVGFSIDASICHFDPFCALSTLRPNGDSSSQTPQEKVDQHLEIVTILISIWTFLILVSTALGNTWIGPCSCTPNKNQVLEKNHSSLCLKNTRTFQTQKLSFLTFNHPWSMWLGDQRAPYYKLVDY